MKPAMMVRTSRDPKTTLSVIDQHTRPVTLGLRTYTYFIAKSRLPNQLNMLKALPIETFKSFEISATRDPVSQFPSFVPDEGRRCDEALEQRRDQRFAGLANTTTVEKCSQPAQRSVDFEFPAQEPS